MAHVVLVQAENGHWIPVTWRFMFPSSGGDALFQFGDRGAAVKYARNYEGNARVFEEVA